MKCITLPISEPAEGSNHLKEKVTTVYLITKLYKAFILRLIHNFNGGQKVGILYPYPFEPLWRLKRAGFFLFFKFCFLEFLHFRTIQDFLSL